MNEDDFQYLEDNFDPNKLRVAQLRYILTLHGIDFSNRVLKKQLIESFNENIVPRRAELRAQYVYAQPSSENIVDSRSSRSEARSVSRSASKSPSRSRARSASPAKPRNTRSRTRQAQAKPELEELPELKPSEPLSPPPKSATPASATPSPRRRRLQRRTNANDEDADISENEKRVVLRPESHQAIVEETSFSNDNVFQTPQRKRPHNDNNEPRKRVASDKHVKVESKPEPTIATKEYSPEPLNEPLDVPPSPIGQVPSSSPVVEKLDEEPAEALPKQEEPIVEEKLPLNLSSSQRKPGFMPSLSALRMSEEFAKQIEPPSVAATPIPETLDEVRIEPASEGADVPEPQAEEAVPVNPKDTEPSEPSENTELSRDTKSTEPTISGVNIVKMTLRAFWLLLRLALVATVVWGFLWYRSELAQADFCGTVQHREPPYPKFLTYPVENPTILHLQQASRHTLDYVWPQCVSCPEHGTCWEGRRLFCDDGYKLNENLLSQAGILSLPPTCAKDWERERAVAVFVEKALWYLRKRAASIACGTPKGPSSHKVTEGYTEPELRTAVYDDKSTRISDEEFSDMWRQVVAAVSTAPDIEMVRFVPSIRSSDKTLTSQRRFSDHGIIATTSTEDEDSQEDEEDWEVEFISHSLDLIPLSCRLRLHVVSWIKYHILELAKIVAGFAGVGLLFLAIKQLYRRRKHRQEAVNRILDALRMRRQAADSDPHLSIYVFTDTLCDRTNTPLIRAVESHSHVQVNQAEQHGEIKRVWAWQP